jgi:hypothetical protein
MPLTHVKLKTKLYAQMLYQCVVSFLRAKPTKLIKGPQILFSKKNSKKSGKVGSSKYANAWLKEFGTQLLPLHFNKVHSLSSF